MNMYVRMFAMISYIHKTRVTVLVAEFVIPTGVRNDRKSLHYIPVTRIGYF